MIVVNFSTANYSQGQKRLASSLGSAKKLMLSDYVSIESPTHQESPYEFKIWAIEAAMRFDNVVLWCDASLWRVGDITKIEKVINEKGYFMEEAGHWVRDWCKPETKSYFELTQDEEAKFFMFSAGLLGIDFNNLNASLWFSEWKKSAIDGHFKGDYKNHRHDMTCGSIIAQRMGFKYERGGSHLSYVGPGYSQPEKDTVFLLQGL